MKQGIKIHTINTNKFKTNIISIFLTTQLTRENVTKNAVLSAILRRGCQKYKKQEEICKKLEEMYGAEFDCGLDKLGKNHILKFYIESINDEFLPKNNENILKHSIEILSEIVFNPFIENNGFNEEYLHQEKKNIKQIIEAKKDNKARYAFTRCVEEMYKDQPEGLYKYGYIDDLDKIDSKNLYEYYTKLINNCKIDVFISGDIEKTNIEEIIEENENFKKLKDRKALYNINLPDIRTGKNQENNIEEKLDINQGKLVIGYDIDIDEESQKNIKFRYIGMIYNDILGGTANSKLFQNVREKASLAYTANSSFAFYTGNIFVTAGIDTENFEKAKDIIKEQIEAMKKGDFSEEDISNVKNALKSNIEEIADEQDTEIVYFFGQELTGRNIGLNDYIKYVEDVNKQDICDFAKRVKTNTIFFLNKEM